MELEYLIENLNPIKIEGNINKKINKIKINSKEVEENDLFISIKGANFDGSQFIQDAIDHGAKVIVSENISDNLKNNSNVTLITVEDSRKALSKLSANYYGNPSKQLTVIGVTGTKGKTTTSNMILQTLQNAGIKCGAISTRGIAIEGDLIKTNNTTPDALEIHKYLKKMLDLGYTHAVVEASSQGFKQNRTDDIDFDIGIFLNIAPDHIGENEHESFEDYLNCKKEIITQSKISIINIDEDYWKYLKDMDFGEFRTFSSEKEADYFFNNFETYQEPYKFGIIADFKGKIPGKIKLPNPGKFNLENALAALATIDILGVNPDIFFKTMENFHVEGRTQLFTSLIDKGRTIFTDWAHNMLSIESLLVELKNYNPDRRLITLYSHEYYETKLRYYPIGEIIGRLSDFVVVTSNSLGNYTFEELLGETIRALDEMGAEYYLIPDREEALKFVVDHSTKDDLIVLLGHADMHYREIDGVKVPFYEEKVLSDYLDEINAKQ